MKTKHNLLAILSVLITGAGCSMVPGMVAIGASSATKRSEPAVAQPTSAPPATSTPATTAATPVAPDAPTAPTEPAIAAPTPAPMPAPAPLATIVASKRPGGDATTEYETGETIHLAITFSKTPADLLAAATRSGCSKETERLEYHTTINGAPVHDDARATGFHTELLRGKELRDTSVAEWLRPKKKPGSLRLGDGFLGEVLPVMRDGKNELALQLVLACFPNDIANEDEIRVEVGRLDLAVAK